MQYNICVEHSNQHRIWKFWACLHFPLFVAYQTRGNLRYLDLDMGFGFGFGFLVSAARICLTIVVCFDSGLESNWVYFASHWFPRGDAGIYINIQSANWLVLFPNSFIMVTSLFLNLLLRFSLLFQLVLRSETSFRVLFFSMGFGCWSFGNPAEELLVENWFRAPVSHLWQVEWPQKTASEQMNKLQNPNTCPARNNLLTCTVKWINIYNLITNWKGLLHLKIGNRVEILWLSEKKQTGRQLRKTLGHSVS